MYFILLQGTSVLSPVIPLSLVVVPAFIIWKKSEQNLYENHPVLYIFAFGLVAAKVTNRLVVSSIYLKYCVKITFMLIIYFYSQETCNLSKYSMEFEVKK